MTDNLQKEFQNKIGVLYEALTKEQKKEYEQKYQLKKEEYMREVALFRYDLFSPLVMFYFVFIVIVILLIRIQFNFRLKNPDYNKKKKTTEISFDNDSAFKNYIQDQLKKISKHDSKPMKDLVQIFEQDWDKLPLSEKLIWFKKSKEKQTKVYYLQIDFHFHFHL